MYILFFIYSIILGIVCYLFFRSQILVLLFYVIVAELCFYLLYKKFYIDYNPFERLAYNISLFIGYFSAVLMYGSIDRNDPNLPYIFD
jgi:uncharacterized membrane protein YfcA